MTNSQKTTSDTWFIPFAIIEEVANNDFDLKGAALIREMGLEDYQAKAIRDFQTLEEAACAAVVAKGLQHTPTELFRSSDPQDPLHGYRSDTKYTMQGSFAGYVKGWTTLSPDQLNMLVRDIGRLAYLQAEEKDGNLLP